MSFFDHVKEIGKNISKRSIDDAVFAKDIDESQKEKYFRIINEYVTLAIMATAPQYFSNGLCGDQSLRRVGSGVFGHVVAISETRNDLSDLNTGNIKPGPAYTPLVIKYIPMTRYFTEDTSAARRTMNFFIVSANDVLMSLLAEAKSATSGDRQLIPRVVAARFFVIDPDVYTGVNYIPIMQKNLSGGVNIPVQDIPIDVVSDIARTFDKDSYEALLTSETGRRTCFFGMIVQQQMRMDFFEFIKQWWERCRVYVDVAGSGEEYEAEQELYRGEIEQSIRYMIKEILSVSFSLSSSRNDGFLLQHSDFHMGNILVNFDPRIFSPDQDVVSKVPGFENGRVTLIKQGVSFYAADFGYSIPYTMQETDDHYFFRYDLSRAPPRKHNRSDYTEVTGGRPAPKDPDDVRFQTVEPGDGKLLSIVGNWGWNMNWITRAPTTIRCAKNYNGNNYAYGGINFYDACLFLTHLTGMSDRSWLFQTGFVDNKQMRQMIEAQIYRAAHEMGLKQRVLEEFIYISLYFNHQWPNAKNHAFSKREPTRSLLQAMEEKKNLPQKREYPVIFSRRTNV